MSNKKVNNKLISFSQHLDDQYGTRGSEMREQYESEFEAFKQEIMKHSSNSGVMEDEKLHMEFSKKRNPEA